MKPEITPEEYELLPPRRRRFYEFDEERNVWVLRRGDLSMAAFLFFGVTAAGILTDERGREVSPLNVRNRFKIASETVAQELRREAESMRGEDVAADAIESLLDRQRQRLVRYYEAASVVPQGGRDAVAERAAEKLTVGIFEGSRAGRAISDPSRLLASSRVTDAGRLIASSTELNASRLLERSLADQFSDEVKTFLANPGPGDSPRELLRDIRRRIKAELLKDPTDPFLSKEAIRQLDFFDKMRREVMAGKPLDPNRIAMYGRAVYVIFTNANREAQEALGMTEERRVLGVAEHCDEDEGELKNCVDQEARKWQPIGTLPPLGQSPCLTNCRCHFEFR